PDDVERALAQRARSVLAAALPEAEARRVTVAVQVVSARQAAKAPCPSGWQIDEPDFRQFRRVVVNASCDGAKGSFIARLQVSAPAWVMKADQPAGHVLAADDVGAELREVHSLAELTAPRDWVGLPLKHSLHAGAGLKASDVERPVLVRRGEKVEIVASQDGVTVAVAGEAMGSGRLGETVSVRNVRTKRVVQGRVTAAQTVEALLLAPVARR
ncbi:MAG TPA: flagellar basal body P-ring formation chaperone FlgA, partial [Rhizobacter sp.]|nr:flagellar basal body P-ring formation chaperone FlgA [Rhizobacter sp.]